MTKNRVCKLCESTTTYVQPNGKIRWYKHEGGYVCNSCYRKDQYRKSPVIKNAVYRWRKENPEKDALWKKNWARNNPEKIREGTRRYKIRHPETCKKYSQNVYEQFGSIFNMTKYQYKHALNGWSKIVQDRENNICQECSNKSEVAHHVLHKSEYPEFSLIPSNGMALCKPCHIQIHRRDKLDN